MPQASVVICTIRPLALPRVLEGLRLQIQNGFEVIVVEGPPLTEAAESMELPPDVVRAHCPERNLARARNIGIQAAAGEVIAFLDDDAVPVATWLSELLGAYEDGRVDGAGGRVLDGHGLWPRWGYPIADRLGRVRFQAAAPTSNQLSPGADPFAFLPGCNMSFRLARLEALGGFDEEFAYGHEDVDISLRMIDSGARLVALDGASVYHFNLPSAVRGEASVWSDPYPAAKSMTYFALRHARQAPSVVDTAIDERASAMLRAAQASLDAGELTARSHSRFEQRVRDGVRAGRASAGHERTRRSPPARPMRPRRGADGARGATPSLRICLLTPAGGMPEADGVARVAAESARALAAHGHELHVITVGARGPRVNFHDGHWHHALKSVDRRLPSLRSCHVDMELYGAAAKYHEVRRIHARAPVDLVVSATWLGESLLCALDPRLSVAVRLVTPVGRIADLDAAGPEAERARALARLERVVLENSPHVQAASRAICRETEEAFGVTLAAPEITPLGTADRSGATPERLAPDDAVAVLFVGRLEPRKGVDVLLAAARELVRERGNVRFIVAGPDNPHAAGYGEQMRAYVRADPALEQRVSFLGWVEDERLWRLYAGADIICAPSRYESYCNVLVEALMFGKPAVACAAGGMPEVIEHGGNGLLAQPGDAQSLRTCLKRLIDDRALRVRQGRRSRELYELRNSHDRVAERMSGAYGEMARARCQPDVDPQAASAAGVEIALAGAIAEICELDDVQAQRAARSLLDEGAERVGHIAELLASPLEDDGDLIAGLYGAVLSRGSDPDGGSRWRSHLRRGGSRLDVLTELADSEEARARNVPAGLKLEVLEQHRRAVHKRAMVARTLSEEEEFLRSLHAAVLCRASGEQWIAENLASLKAGHSRESVAEQLARSPEARSLGVPLDWL